MADINQDLLLAVLAMLTGAVPRGGVARGAAGMGRPPGPAAGRIAEGAGGASTRTGRGPQLPGFRPSASEQRGPGASLDAWNAQALTQDMLTELETTTAGSSWARRWPRAWPRRSPGREGAAAASSYGPSFPASPATSGSS